MGNLEVFQFSTVQTRQQPKPVTMAAAATVAPTTKLTFLTGQVQLATLTPNDAQAYQEVTLVFTHAAPGAFLTTGNLQVAYQPIQNRPIDLCYDPIGGKWWVKAVV